MNQTTTPKPKRRFARSAADTIDTPAKPAATRRKSKSTGDSKPDAAPRMTKAGIVIGLLSRPEGATIVQMCEATGWQQHSVRGFLAGTVKKKPDVALTSAKADGVRTYRLVAAEGVSA